MITDFQDESSETLKYQSTLFLSRSQTSPVLLGQPQAPTLPIPRLWAPDHVTHFTSFGPAQVPVPILPWSSSCPSQRKTISR
jgi:hypothetical protein